jgi:predicted transcriptional regulator
LANLSLSDTDLYHLLTLLRSSDRPMTTDELVAALRQRAAS